MIIKSAGSDLWGAFIYHNPHGPALFGYDGFLTNKEYCIEDLFIEEKDFWRKYRNENR